MCVYSVRVVLVLLPVFLNVACQVCNETRSIYREVPETFRFTYIETYQETDCVIFCSVKTRTAVNITSKIVQVYENVTTNVCCEGYVTDDNHEGNGLYCQPICDPPCQNGFCKRPNECACDVGHVRDPLNSHICKPLCLQDCDIPDCISMEMSQCFSYDTESAIPMCTQPCVNATCMASGVCECFPGFVKTSANVCEPSVQCGQGIYRTDLGRCDCDLGYQWKCGTCEPICYDCEHGTCVYPQECECNPGYTKSEQGKCKPHCSNGCLDGECIGPEACRCNPGWYMLGNGQCMPHCDMSCHNGECISPNVCVCLPGYHHSGGEDPKCVKSKNCEDSLEGCEFAELPVEVLNDPVQDPDVNIDHSREINTQSSPDPTPDEENITKSYKSNNALKKANVFGIRIHWICGVVTVAALIILVIIAFLVKRKCYKGWATNSTVTNEDVVVNYINKLS